MNDHDRVSVTFRGSYASAKMIERVVNRLDSRSYRAGGADATAQAEIYDVGVMSGPPVRSVASCTVDAYDGRHELNVGDELVSTDDGWEVRSPSSGPTLEKDRP